MEKTPLPHNRERNCYPPYPDHYLKATWKLVGTLIKRKTKSQTTPLRITRNNKIYTNNEDIADQFNKHFIIM